MLFEKLTQGLIVEPSYNIYSVKDVNRVTKREKWRTVYDPNEAMRTIQARFRRYLRGLRFFLPSATAIPGFNPQLNVGRHIHNRFFYLTDLKNAYQHVSLERWVDILISLDPSTEKRELEEASLRFLFVTDPKGTPRGLATGGLASVEAFNIYAGVVLDTPLRALATRHGLVYTRFLDDLTFSAPSPIGEKKRRQIRDVVVRAGFTPNHKKSLVQDLEKGPLVITGIGLAKRGRRFLPRHFTQRINATLNRVEKGKESPQKAHGLMGVFTQATDMSKSLNQTELRIRRRYQKMRRNQKNKKEK